MLNVFVTYTDKKREELSVLLSLSLSMELDVPADSLTLTVPYADRLADADYITVQEDGVTVFYGQTDEIAAFLTAKSRVTRITARSLAGALLDNEAEPLSYRNPTAVLMYRRYLQPGIFRIISPPPKDAEVLPRQPGERPLLHLKVMPAWTIPR